MTFLQREFERLNGALHDQKNVNKYDLLYAAQQAVAWASDPNNYKAPMELITGTPGDLGDYLERNRLPQS
jgi:hypothetical protein